MGINILVVFFFVYDLKHHLGIMNSTNSSSRCFVQTIRIAVSVENHD